MTVALLYNLKSGRLIPPVPFFFLKIALAIRGLFCFHTNCEIFCSSSVKNTIGSSIGIALNLWIALGSIAIFTTLSLPIQEHGVSLHLFVSCLISFISQGFSNGSGKESTCNAGNTGDVGLIPGLGRWPGGGNGNPLQYCCLRNPMDRGTWQAKSMGSQRVRHDRVLAWMDQCHSFLHTGLLSL